MFIACVRVDSELYLRVCRGKIPSDVAEMRGDEPRGPVRDSGSGIYEARGIYLSRLREFRIRPFPRPWASEAALAKVHE